MNQQMLLTGLRIAIQWACASLVTRGVMTAEDAAGALQQADVVLPALIGAGLYFYQLRQRRQTAILAEAAKVPGVGFIRTTDQDLANAVPSRKVVGPSG